LLDAVMWYYQQQDALGKRFQGLVVPQFGKSVRVISANHSLFAKSGHFSYILTCKKFQQKESQHAHSENYL